ncbi:MAG: DNA repair protein RecO [bacterium]|nr:DNA repair protein RecO [bacterium]
MRKLPLYKTKGIVLLTRKAKEADKNVVLYTLDYGKMEFCAKGLRKIRSRLGAGLEPFTLTEIAFWWGEQLAIIREAKIIHSYSEIKEDLYLIESASFLTRTVDRLTQQNHPDKNLFALIISSFLWLSEGPNPLIKPFFSLKLLSLLGLLPQMNQCVCCQKKKEEAKGFSLERGGLVCEAHNGDSFPASQQAIHILSRLSSLNILAAKRITIAESIFRELEETIERWLNWQLSA